MREDIEAAVGQLLDVGESVEIVTPLAVGRADGAATFALLLPLVVLWQRWQLRSSASAAGDAFGIPLAPRSLLVLTDHRFLVWRLDRRKVGAFLGEVPRASVSSVTTATIGQGWRTCLFRMADGSSSTLRVVGSAADQLAVAFSST